MIIDWITKKEERYHQEGTTYVCIIYLNKINIPRREREGGRIITKTKNL